jgi:sugar phosphate isomerase/epimerase
MKNKLILGTSNANWSRLTLTEQFRTIAKHGLRYINIHLEREYTDEELAEAIKDFKQLNLISGQLSTSLMPDSYKDDEDYKKAMEILNKLIELQKQLGGSQIAIGAGTFTKKKALYSVASIKFMQEASDCAKENDMIIALDIDPDDNQLVGTWDRALEYQKDVDRDNFMLNANVGLFNFLGIRIENSQLPEVKIAQLHITDNDGSAYDKSSKIGEGTADISGWVQKAKPLLEDICSEFECIPAAVILFNDADQKEVKMTLDYLANILPGVGM